MTFIEELEKLQEQINAGEFNQTSQQEKMGTLPLEIRSDYQGSGKLKDKVALISGGDSGIGRSIARYFAREGAKLAILYFEHEKDAQVTADHAKAEGVEAIIVQCDQRDSDACQAAVAKVVNHFGSLNILVNNAAWQTPSKGLADIEPEQLQRTFETNVYGYFYMTKAVLPHLGQGDSILNSTSVVAYHGHEMLIDYSATKGAVSTFTRSMASSLVKKGIRVNGVAPGPIWTPFITGSFPPEEAKGFGKSTPMERCGQPCELAGAYVFLASQEATYITGQVIHVNGGDFIHS